MISILYEKEKKHKKRNISQQFKKINKEGEKFVSKNCSENLRMYEIQPILEHMNK